MSSSDKWNCLRCTYENWPRALRCTICAAARPKPPAPLIEEAEPRVMTPPPASVIIQPPLQQHLGAQQQQQQSHPPLAKHSAPVLLTSGSKHTTDNASTAIATNAVAATTATTPATTGGLQSASNHGSSGDSVAALGSLGSLSLTCPMPSGKWPCSKCTYLNWPKSARCVQCRGPRGGQLGSPAGSPLPRSPSPPARASPEASTSQTLPVGTIRCASLSPSTPSTTTTTTATTTTASSHDLSGTGGGSGGVSSVGLGQKWSCPTCTYANWPKSQRCVMCYTSWPINNNHHSNNNHSNRNNNNHNNNHNHHHNSSHDNNIVGNTNQTTAVVHTGQPTSSPQFSSTARSCSPPVIIETAGVSSGGAMAGAGVSSYENEEAEINNYFSTRRCASNRQQQQHGNKAVSMSSADRLWLNACLGVLEDNIDPVLRYVDSGKDIFRTLTNLDVQHLRALWMHHQNPGPLYIEPGLSLIYLCVKLQRDDILTHLLAASDTSGGVVPKRVPSEVCQETAADIRRHVAASFKQRKGTDFACYFVTDNVTFALPSEIEHLHPSVQKILFDELLDRDVQKELEEESPIINWSLELTQRLGSRLYALWNRSAGDCLLDSVLQATWGVFDRDNTLRRILADSLCDAAALLYPRWKEAEAWQANLMHYSLAEAQWQEDWAVLVSLASQPGAALEQLHIFTLAHVFRRPIIVYGVKCIKSFRGEELGLARFEGIYLPLLWECPSFCWKSPIALGYTRGHFSALVPIEPPDVDVIARGGAHSTLSHRQDDIIYLPLMTADRKLLPIHFLTKNEMGREEELIREWLDFRLTEGGLLVALQRLQPPLRRPTLVTQMLDEWLHLYRNLSLGKNATNARLNQLLSMAAERTERVGGQGEAGSQQQQQQQTRQSQQVVSEEDPVSESE